MMLRALAALSLVLAVGCEDEAPAEFPTIQACFDDYYDDGAGLLASESILECCLLHPIDGQKPACGATQADCINYLTANLSQTSASTTEVMDSCATYADQL